jgi:hypothetical protein
VKQADLRDMVRKASKSACSSVVVISLDPLSATPTSSAVKTPQNTEEDPDDCEIADGGHIQMEYSSD